MKTLKRIFLLGAGIFLILSCSKDQPLTLPGATVQEDDLTCGKVFKVQPTKGTDITEDLKQAFEDAKSAGPGSVVELQEGEFEIGQIEIGEFYGSFVGAGKGKTLITSKTGLTEPTGLIGFTGGDVKVSNMTISTPEEAICPDGSGLPVLLNFSDWSEEYPLEERFVRAFVDNVEFIGFKLGTGGYEGSGYNAYTGLQATSEIQRLNIEITITNCSFDMFGFGTAIIGGKSGKYILGNKQNGNIYTNCLESAFIYDIINMPVKVVGNKFYVPAASFGLDVANFVDSRFIAEEQTSPTLVIIDGNDFIETQSALLGLFIRDNHRIVYPAESPMDVQVKNNRFRLSNSLAAIGCFHMNGMVIRNNIFSGNSQFGVRVMRNNLSLYNENGLMLGNNFSNLSCSAVTLLLNIGSRNWTIIGGDLGESVINLGVDNVITGFNVFDSDDPLGQTIVDNMEEIKDTWHFYFGH